MTSWFQRSLARTRGLRPVLIMLALLAASEAALHWGPAEDALVRATDRLWLDRAVTRRIEEVWTIHQDLAEAPMLEAYGRALARHPARRKVVIVGDSVIWQVPARPSFSERLRPVLVRAYDDPDLAVSTWSMPGLTPAAGYYLLKRISRETSPALVVFEINPIWLGQEYANIASRTMAFVDRDGLGPSEAETYDSLLRDSRPMEEEGGSWAGFNLAHWYFRCRHGSRLRSLMLPAGVFTGWGSRCYFLDCQDVNDVYWRDLWAKGKRGQNLQENYRSFALDEAQSLNYRYTLLITELARQRGFPLAVLVPPRNGTMLEMMGVRSSGYGVGDELTERLRARGVFVINCQTAAPEELFRDDQHLRADGFDDWVGCLGPPLSQFIRENMTVPPPPPGPSPTGP